MSVDPFLSQIMDMDRLHPVFGLFDKAAGPVQITFDRGEPAIGDLREEIDEVESRVVDVAALFSVVRLLTADAFLRQTLDGRSGRAALMAHEAQVAEIPGDLAAGEGFARVARSCLIQVSTNAQLLRCGSDREALHQLCVPAASKAPRFSFPSLGAHQ